MEFAASLPSSLKLHGSTKKYILKKVAETLLPHEILARPKMGFGVPLEPWFRNELKPLAFDVLLSRQLRERGYFHEPVIRRLLDEHVGGLRSWHYQLWNLLMLELWHRRFIDRPGAASSAAEGRGAAVVA